MPQTYCSPVGLLYCIGQLKCDGTRTETIFRLSAKRTSPFKSAGGRQFSRLLRSWRVRISGSNAGFTTFRGSVKGTGYPLHSPVSSSLSLPCVSSCAITFQLDSTSSLLGPNIPLNTLSSDTLSLRYFLNVSHQFSHPYIITGKIIVLYILMF